MNWRLLPIRVPSGEPAFKLFRGLDWIADIKGTRALIIDTRWRRFTDAALIEEANAYLEGVAHGLIQQEAGVTASGHSTLPVN